MSFRRLWEAFREALRSLLKLRGQPELVRGLHLNGRLGKLLPWLFVQQQNLPDMPDTLRTQLQLVVSLLYLRQFAVSVGSS